MITSNLNEKFSKGATNEDFANAIKDEFGVFYSKDGKKLLKCYSKNINSYSIKKGTQEICDFAFEDCEYLKQIDIYPIPS